MEWREHKGTHCQLSHSIVDCSLYTVLNINYETTKTNSQLNLLNILSCIQFDWITFQFHLITYVKYCLKSIWFWIGFYCSFNFYPLFWFTFIWSWVRAYKILLFTAFKGLSDIHELNYNLRYLRCNWNRMMFAKDVVERNFKDGRSESNQMSDEKTIEK